MAKSTTKSETPTEFDLEKIRRFTEQELAKLSNSELPFCFQLGTTLIVGQHKVVKVNEKCWQVYKDHDHVFDFYSRKSAIFYCIAQHKRDSQLAASIKTSDQTLGQLDFEAILYRHRYKQALAKKDSWGAEFYSNKYQLVMERTAQVKKELQKSLNLAKYIKV